jgi:hypothetical protein
METIKEIIGTGNLVAALVVFVFAVLGIATNLLISSTKRDPNSTNTPFEFSWKYLFSDNVKRLLASFISTMLILRFTPQFWDIADKELFYLYAAGIGGAFDRAAELLKSKTNFLSK